MANLDNWSTLLNFDSIPNGIISGKTADEVEQIALESMNTLYNMDIDEFEQSESFVELEPEIVAEMNIIENCLKNENTEKQTKKYTELFKRFYILVGDNVSGSCYLYVNTNHYIEINQ